MPYNTRRKSLSLPQLGTALPGAPRSARSPPSSTDVNQLSPPAKKVKRLHSDSASTSTLSTPNSSPRNLPPRFDERPKSAGRPVAHTPPPSPGGLSPRTKVDTEGIDDIIVVAVIEQLEKTGNRPHLLKELAHVLQATIPIVESSANPAAIISSRLATYLKRSWTALSRCPLDKKLVGTHPKRIYYFLTTCPHQPIPNDAGATHGPARIISPSLSEEEDMEMRSRDHMSPSPELDLSTPEYDDGLDPFSTHSRPSTNSTTEHNRRAQSPPLEKEEREFTQTATNLQQRRRSQEATSNQEASAPSEEFHRFDIPMYNVPELREQQEEAVARENSETAAALFGQLHQLPNVINDFVPNSPLLKTSHTIDLPPAIFKFGESRLDQDDFDWAWAMKSPEHIELHELDELLGDF
ncbi:uncharacterized protein EI97DRAFT_369658 [Westerdykella ornata]|uniref:GDS1 winged helix domain-containing protein n=1 Tax=Westerdykella ornata TaxID=318751 RepID=A0A6A6JYY2_WESOR|nr:uncharacterized protein EI97DRAFT_369658 [Westerdykella ornata]KAF2280249.1 hypothetical protein EI97DRAFT_369658 [Westerdykella ornata]